MGAMVSQITSLTIVYSTVYSGADQSSVSLPLVWGIHWWPVNSPHKGPVTWKITSFDYVIMDFAVITMPADDPVLLSAGISAATVIAVLSLQKVRYLNGYCLSVRMTITVHWERARLL